MTSPAALDAPWTEAQRLAALDAYEVLDTPAEAPFDDIARLAARLLDMPVALVTLVAEERQWFKAAVGTEVRETPRSVSFCDHAIAGREPLVVPDLAADLRFRANPLVTGDPRVRFYAGAPLRTPEGLPLGTLCVLDLRPRDFGSPEVETLQVLAGQVMTQLELRRALRQRAASEAELRLLADAAPLVIASLDAQERYRFVNQAYGDWIGRPLEEIVGRTILEVLGEEAHASRRGALAKVLAGEAVTFESFLPRPDGTRRETEQQYLPRRAASGEVEGFFAIITDITARKAEERSLRSHNEELEALIAERTEALKASEKAALRLYNRSPVPQHSIDADGRYLAVSDGWLEMMGYRRDEVLGRRFFDFVAPHEMDRLRAAFVALRAAGEVRDFEYELVAKDGTPRPVLVTTRVEYDDQGRFVRSYGVTLDLRARKAAEAALAKEAAERRRAEEALSQAQKMQALGQLTGGIAHDFNNLLTVIQGSADFLRRPDLPPERRERYVNAIVETAARAASLTHQLLAFARKQPLRPEVFDLNRRVEAMAEVLRRTLGARYEVETDLAAELWPVEADPTQLEVAVLNIGVNARDAMPDGGALTIRTRNIALSMEGSGATGDFVCLSLTDTGAGIPQADLEHVFEPFFTTKALGKGTGLGLSQVYGFAAQSGGDAQIESRLGEGTSVILHLPRARRLPAAAPLRVEVPRRGEGRVLLADDNPQVGEFAQSLIEELGYRVVRVESGVAALALVEAGERFDVVFSDIVMPGMTGLELAHALRRVAPGLPVVLTTGYSDAVAKGETLGLPVLPKPYRLEALASALAQALTTRSAA